MHPGEAVKALDTVGIIGLGLIGASLGMAIRQRSLAARIIGVDIEPDAIAVAKRRGAIDDGASTLEVLREADLVIVAVPPASVVAVAQQMAARMKPHSVLTDVASTKRAIVESLDQSLPRHVHYVGSHPMAGSEGQGAASADPALLSGRPFVLTPTERTNAQALALLKDLVERLGMRPVLLAPADHDDVVAQVSHVPYLLAVAVVNSTTDAALEVRGPALAELLRIASSPPQLWVQICQANRDAIIRALRAVRRELDQLERTLGDGPSLEPLLERARHRSQAIRSHHATGA